MIGIGELDEHTMRTGRQILNDHGNTARGCPVPRQIVQRDMKMADTRRHPKRRLPKHRYNPNVLSPVLENDHAARQWCRQRRVDEDPGRWLFCGQGHDHRCRCSRDLGRCLRQRAGGAKDGDNTKEYKLLRRPTSLNLA